MTQKIICPLMGWVGDLVNCTVAVRSFKAQNPDSHITFAVGKRFAHTLVLFQGLPYIDNFHVWDSDDHWPTQSDLVFIRENKFDRVFNPLSPHTRPDWYNHFHMTEETCRMLNMPFDGNLQCELGLFRGQEFPVDKKLITMSLWASGNQESKSPKIEVIEKLSQELGKNGCKLVQVGRGDRIIKGVENLGSNLSLVDGVRLIKSSVLHISIDCGWGWIASAYRRPVVGMFGLNYPDMRPGRQVSHNPFNPNATYINKNSVKDVGFDELYDVIIGKL